MKSQQLIFLNEQQGNTPMLHPSSPSHFQYVGTKDTKIWVKAHKTIIPNGEFRYIYIYKRLNLIFGTLRTLFSFRFSEMNTDPE